MKKEHYRILNTPLVHENDSKIITTGIIYLIVFVILFSIPGIPRSVKGVYFLLRIPASFYAIHKAETLNRNRLLWWVITMINPVIGLTCLGLLEIKINISSIKEIVKKLRTEYNFELSKIRINNANSRNELTSNYSKKLKSEIEKEFEKKIENTETLIEDTDAENLNKKGNIVFLIIVVILIFASIYFIYNK